MSSEPTTQNPYRFGFPTLFALFAIELLAINLARLPESMRFDRFAFCDHGANLTLQYLVGNGMRPALDFGYHYGLLPALVGKIWFAIFGATPWAYQFAMLVLNLLFAWAFAKILAQLKIGGVGLVLAIITVGYAFQATYINFAHAIEAVLLCHAIAEQARGSRINALALASAAVFAKPSMGYVYGLVLIILIMRDLMRDGFNLRRLAFALMSTAVVFSSLGILLSCVYGTNTLIRTALPIEGATAYHSLKYGLLASGRGLWDPSGLPWLYYFIDVAGFWIVATVLLFASAIFLVLTGEHKNIAARRIELVVTCAILHLAFLALFFGNQWSWIYYSYVLVIGAVIALEPGPSRQHLGVALCALALLSWTDVAFWTHRWWITTAPDSATAGLWAPADERAEWLRVLSTSKDHKTVMLDSMGATELLFHGFEDPVSLYLTRGLMMPNDVRRKVAELSSAEIVVVPITISACSGIPDAPEFIAAMKRFDTIWVGKHFEVYQARASDRLSYRN